MKLKYTYSFQEYDDRYLAIVDFLENDRERRMLWVNECGKSIMEFLQNEITEDELNRLMIEKYSGDITTIKASVSSFVKQLSAANLIG